MPNSPLLPEQEALLCELVEAHNRLKPRREPFGCLKDMTGPADIAILMHSGWLKDSEPVFLGDLDALAEGGYIRRKPLKRGWKFELTPSALAYRKPREHPVDQNSRTKAVQGPESGEQARPSATQLLMKEQPDGGLAKRATDPAHVEGLSLPAYCRVITREEVRALTRVEYDELVKCRSEYDMFIDGMTGVASYRMDDGECMQSKLGPKEQAILLDVIQAGKRIRPRETKTGRTCPSAKSACRLLEKARRKVDVSLGRYGYRAIHVHRNPTDPGLKTFEFAPSADLHYCVIVTT